MKLIWKSDDGKSVVVGFTEQEFQLVIPLLIDDYFMNNFEAHDVSKTKTIEYLIIQKDRISIDDCLGYLKHCFVTDIIDPKPKPKKKR